MSHHYEYCYTIVNEEDITQTMMEESLNSGKSYISCLDGSKGVLKFKVHHPDSMAGYVKHSLEDILVIISGPDWTEE